MVVGCNCDYLDKEGADRRPQGFQHHGLRHLEEPPRTLPRHRLDEAAQVARAPGEATGLVVDDCQYVMRLSLQNDRWGKVHLAPRTQV